MGTSTGKKEYTLKINGVAQNIKDVTKLEETLNALDVSLSKARETNIKATVETRKSTQALTEEEKAAQKLANTQARIEQVNSDANRAQIEANITLREATRETTRNIAINNLAEGSIRQMGMSLTDLRNEYESLSAAQRIDEEQGGKLIAQIQALDVEYKALRESTGNYRDSVGNYEKGIAGLKDLKDKFELASRGSVNLASDLVGTNEVLDTFGGVTDAVAQSSEQVAAVMGLVTISEEAYNAIVKEGIITQKAAAVMDGVRTFQLRAKTAAEALATKGTLAATVAQYALNVAAYANPYVLLALALATVVGAVYLLARNTDDAAESQTEFNTLQAIHLDQLDAEASKLKEVSDKRVRSLENDLAVLNARGAKLEEIRKAETRLANEREFANAEQRGFYSNELADLEKNRAKVDAFRSVLAKLNIEKAKGNDKIKIDLDLDGKIDNVKIEEALTAVQGSIDNYGRKVKVAVDINTEADELAAQAKVAAAQRVKQDTDNRKELADKAKEARAAELSAIRSGQDARVRLISNSYDRERKTIQLSNSRAIEDLKIKLATETNLTAGARKAINENIKTIGQIQFKELQALADERNAAQLVTARAAQDSETALIISGGEKKRAEIKIQYDREIEDVKKRLDTEKELTAAQREDLLKIMLNKRRQQDAELATLNAATLEASADAELSALDSLLEASKQKIGELTVRDKEGFKFIDVEATRNNLAQANEALGDYVGRVKEYQSALQKAHEATLATLKKGAPEYVAEVQKYTDAQLAATKKIKEAQKEQVENTETANGAQLESLKEYTAKVAEYAQLASELVGGLVDTLNMGLQVQVDEMTAQLDAINVKYEEAQKQREDAVKNVEDTEALLQSATGGTAQALKEQLADAMAARNEAAREEQRLAKEKEKREAEIAKKEKQMRRNDLIANIAGGIANTANGVTKALGLVFPLNLFVAGLVGAMGLAQVGIMTKQLTKLSAGGPIIGPSHANGGVDIGLGYEAEGGEYMINKKSYAANGDLVRFINENPQSLTASDLLGLVPSEGTPAASTAPSQTSNADLLEALENIDFKPVVSVTDINDVNDRLADVQDLAGF